MHLYHLLDMVLHVKMMIETRHTVGQLREDALRNSCPKIWSLHAFDVILSADYRSMGKTRTLP